MPLEGFDPLEQFKPQPAMLTVHLLDLSNPKAPTAAAGGHTAAGSAAAG